ncbi:MAG: helix-turn-helix transcriptional regulator [Clostridia bacterium]|nr:helix-turn-helix transcriptional regulator [Clostridia bacterium]
MAGIGEQIIQARKAKGMTQDALAEALNVSRSTISNWETGRRMPNAQMLAKLSKLLDHSFVVGVENVSPPAAETVCAASEPDPAAPEQEPVSTPGRRLWWLAVAAAVLVCLCVALLLYRAHRPTVYTDGEGNRYSPEQFQQLTPREEGKAWLSVETVLRTQHADGMDMWMYEFTFHEMNGVGMTIDRLELDIFVDATVHPRIFSGEGLSELGLESRIEPGGDWSVSGGMPVQEKVKGVGMVLTGTDDTGQQRTFSDFLALKTGD